MRASHVLDIYGTELHVATTRREWFTLRRRLDFLSEPDAAGLTCTALHQRKDGLDRYTVAFWVNVERMAGVSELVETCAHEAAHGAGSILRYVGHDEHAFDEPHAYLVGWLTRWLFEHTRPEVTES